MVHSFGKNLNPARIVRSALFGALLFVSVATAGFLFFADHASAEGKICVRGNCLDDLRELPVNGNFGRSLRYYKPARVCYPQQYNVEGIYAPYCYNEDQLKQGGAAEGYCQQNYRNPDFGRNCAAEYEAKVTNTTGPLCIKGRCWGQAPSITNFTVNGDAYAVAVDYCTKTADLAWSTQNAQQVTVRGERITNADVQRVKYDVNGSLRGLRPKKDTEYSLIAETAIDSSERASIPVYVYRTQCYEDCAFQKAEDAYFAGPPRLNATTTVRRCVFALCADIPQPSEESLMLHTIAVAGAAIVDVQTKGVLRFEGVRLVLLELAKAYLIYDEFTKRVQVCSDKLPDEDFDITSIYNNVSRGAWKGLPRGFIRGLLGGLIGLIGDPCNPFITVIAQQLGDALIGFLDDQFGDAIAAQFGSLPDSNFPGERIGYKVGNDIGYQIGVVTPRAIMGVVDWISESVTDPGPDPGGDEGDSSKEQKVVCSKVIEDNLDPPPDEKPAAPEVSGPACTNPKGCVASVGVGMRKGDFKDMREDQARTSNVIQVNLQVVGIREEGGDGVATVGSDDHTWGANNAGKTILVGKDPYSQMSTTAQQAFNRKFIKNVEQRKAEGWNTSKAVENEFRYAAGKKGMSKSSINTYVASPEFQNIIRAFNY